MSQYQSSISKVAPSPFFNAPEKKLVVELDAGLEILEYLATAKTPVTFTAIATSVGASNATLFRVLNVLEERGYIAKSNHDKTYRSTGRSCLLDVAAVPVQRLITHARPAMQALCEDIAQSCNLSVFHDSQLIVIAQVASPAPLCISVPVGFTYDVENTMPGQVYTAFSQASWGSPASPSKQTHPSVVTSTIELGFSCAENPSIPGVIDLSCPIFLDDKVAGVLTIPYVKIADGASQQQCLVELQRAARDVNHSLLNTPLAS